MRSSLGKMLGNGGTNAHGRTSLDDVRFDSIIQKRAKRTKSTTFPCKEVIMTANIGET
jgi:hypothetical protein